MAELSAYEQKQVDQIAGWKAEPPMLVIELFEKMTHPMVRIAKQFLPEMAVVDAISAAYKASEVFAHKESVLTKAGVADIRSLRRSDMQRCDKLADEFAVKAGEGAMVRGAVISGAGGLGAVLGMEVMVTYALKTIHTVGYCYGYTPEDPRERDFALGILLIAAAGSLEEKQQAIAETDKLKEYVAEEIVEDLTKEAIENMAEGAIERIAQQAAEEVISERILESGAMRSVPFLGVLFGAISDAAVAQYIGRVAKFSFQERWLAANGKVRSIAPDPKLARSRLRRAEGVLATGAYWTSFLASFVVSFPPLVVGALLPEGNPLERGFADGRRDAASDAKQLAGRLKSTLRVAAASEPPVAALPAVEG
ncbi:MAG: EcsC family protein [Pirellulales bacterium]